MPDVPGHPENRYRVVERLNLRTMSETEQKAKQGEGRRVLYIFTRTPLHVGAGSSIGAIDQPIQRERHTRFPMIPGSSIKGVLRDEMIGAGTDVLDDLFGKGGDGKDSRAGSISFGEAKLLLFPVRSAKGAFALATSPLVLQRFARDARVDLAVPSAPKDMACLAGAKVTFQDKKAVVLEEYRFAAEGEFPAEWQKLFVGLLDDAVLRGAEGRFVLLSDGDLSHFTVNACQVNQHVRIDDETGTAEDGGLFNEETVPSETLFYSVLTETRKPRVDNKAFDHLSKERLAQFGGNSTTGLGFCTVKLG